MTLLLAKRCGVAPKMVGICDSRVREAQEPMSWGESEESQAGSARAASCARIADVGVAAGMGSQVESGRSD
jgi:hypothetical protein